MRDSPGAYLVGLNITSELVHFPIRAHPQLKVRETRVSPDYPGLTHLAGNRRDESLIVRDYDYPAVPYLQRVH